MSNLDRLHQWCTLWRMPKIGAKRFAHILKVFGSPEAFFSSARPKIPAIDVDKNAIDLARKQAEADINWLLSSPRSHIITQRDSAYPKQLLHIADPPPLLFVQGDIDLLSKPQLAIVGSRSASHEGIDNAKQFSAYLTRQGIIITSGLALGIDAAAHRGSLSLPPQHTLRGQTIAIMGTGPDKIYPSRHVKLAEKILEKGCIITELPVGTPVVAHAFPRRNRIISGLSLGTLIVEASLKSGSLITARTAIEQNREVFAIPGSIHNPLARGCNDLIRKGAKLVETAKDIFEELQQPLLSFVRGQKSDTLEKANVLLKVDKSPQQRDHEQTQHALPLFDDPDKETLWNALSFDPQPVDILAKRSRLPVSQVSSMLLILELEGYVCKHPSGRYQRKGE